MVSREDDPLLAALYELTDRLEGTNLCEVRAKVATPADVKDLPDAYLFFIDMPGIVPGEIKVDLEDDCVLVISGERKREEEEKYQMTERRMGKQMRKFKLQENANTEAISAVCVDGVLTVTIEKLPPPEPMKLKRIEIKIA